MQDFYGAAEWLVHASAHAFTPNTNKRKGSPPLMFASLRFSYERLSADFPEYDSYKLYHAQVCQTPIYWGFFFVSLKPLFPDCVCVCLLSLTRWLLQALYKACLYDEAMDIVVKLDNPDLHTEIMKLQVLKQPWCLC